MLTIWLLVILLLLITVMSQSFLNSTKFIFRAMDQFPFPALFPVWHPVYMVSMSTNLVTIPMAAHLLDPTTIPMVLSTVLQPTAKGKDMLVRFRRKKLNRNGILLPKLFWPTARKKCSSDEKNFEAEGWEFANFLRSLVQFIQTVKGQKNFW